LFNEGVAFCSLFLGGRASYSFHMRDEFEEEEEEESSNKRRL
jgi:hypothetical protein